MHPKNRAIKTILIIVIIAGLLGAAGYAAYTAYKSKGTAGSGADQRLAQDHPCKLAADLGMDAGTYAKLIEATKSPSQDYLCNDNVRAIVSQYPTKAGQEEYIAELVKLNLSVDDMGRRVKVNAIDTALLSYHGRHDALPSVAQLADDTWITEQFGETVDRSAFRFPPNEANAITGAANPTTEKFSYLLQDKNGNPCAEEPCHGYIISIKMSDGSVYSRQYPDHMQQHHSAGH